MINYFGYLVSFLAAIPVGAGIGGGGFFIVYLISRGFTQITAGAMNLIFFLSGSICSLPFHLRKRKLNFRVIFFAALLGIGGSFLGGKLRGMISEDYLRQFFGVLLIFTGFRSLFRKNITNFPSFPSTEA